MIDFEQIRRDYPLKDTIASMAQVEWDRRKSNPNQGDYWACCPLHGEKTPSFHLEEGKGLWYCYGCGQGGDVINFVELWNNSTRSEAIRILTGEEPPRGSTPQRFHREDAPDPYAGFKIVKPPIGAPEIIAGQRTPEILNPKNIGDETKRDRVTYVPSMVFPYTNKRGEVWGYVLRVEFKDGKITPAAWWTQGNGFEGWAHGSFPEPRPLYKLHRLHEQPDWQVLIVEGEKCADAAERVLAGKRIVPVTWMGGGKAISKTKWDTLAGRSVVIWPDADEEGLATVFGHVTPAGKRREGIMDYLFSAGVASVKVVNPPKDKPKGWDIADAEAEGINVAEFIRLNLEEWNVGKFEDWKSAGTAKPDRLGEVHSESGHDAPRAGPDESNGREERPSRNLPAEVVGISGSRVSTLITEENWYSYTVRNEDGGLKSTSSQNVSLFLEYDPRFRGIFAWNEFAQYVSLMRRPPWDEDPSSHYPRRLLDTDITGASNWLEYSGISAKENSVQNSIYLISKRYAFNPVLERLNSIVWDGIPRVRGGATGMGDSQMPLLAEYFGAEDTEINAAFGEKWLISAVARAMKPGCKVDTMLILEGPQGLMKSTALKALADGIVPGMFTDEISDPGSKDAAMQMQGVWIIELSELDSLSRASITSIKAWLTRTTDRIRKPYGRVVEDLPRSCVLAGTVNPLGNSGYLKDATGNRRFWPVETTFIDIQRIRNDAEQIWAEAVHYYRQGKQWWLTREEEVLASAAQSRRYEDDPWAETIDAYTVGVGSVSLQSIMGEGCLSIPNERRNQVVTRRITSHMVRRGWSRTEDNGRILFIREDMFSAAA